VSPRTFQTALLYVPRTAPRSTEATQRQSESLCNWQTVGRSVSQSVSQSVSLGVEPPGGLMTTFWL